MTLFGKNLKKYLAEKGMTQTQLANELGIKQPTVNDWINKGINLAHATKSTSKGFIRVGIPSLPITYARAVRSITSSRLWGILI